MDEERAEQKVEETMLARAVDVFREELLPARLYDIADEKLVAAYMLSCGQPTTVIAETLGVPLGALHAWLAYDEEVREAIDRFNEVREQEIYSRVLDILASLLQRDDLTPEQLMSVLGLGLRMKHGSDTRSQTRRRIELKEQELDLRMAALQSQHKPSFDWVIELKEQSDGVFSADVPQQDTDEN